jgi:hypothetical protein
MCIYCDTKHYRKIYENHHGIIPRQSDGRSYDIHHIDGNHTNNHPDNLKAVTINEHYDLHYAQKEYSACFKMAYRMKLSVNELSELARQSALQRVEKGPHPWAGKNSISTLRSQQGTHHWQNGNNPIYSRTKEELSRFATATNLKRVAEGRHPSQIKKTCPHCGTIMDTANYAKHHGDKCKQKPINQSVSF